MSANDARVDAVLRGDVGTLDAIVDDFYGGDAGKVRDATETRAVTGAGMAWDGRRARVTMRAPDDARRARRGRCARTSGKEGKRRGTRGKEAPTRAPDDARSVVGRASDRW